LDPKAAQQFTDAIQSGATGLAVYQGSDYADARLSERSGRNETGRNADL